MATSMADLPMVGGHLALDLVNTVEPRFADPDPTDRLASAGDLLTWARRSGVIDSAEEESVRLAWQAPGAGERAHREALEIREALYQALLATLGSAADSAPELEFLSMRWAAAAARSELRVVGDHGHLMVGTSPALTIPDRAAHAAVDLLTRTNLGPLRTCPPEEDGCGWLFLDHSRNGSRKWCEMDGGCGAIAKARRLTERRRARRHSATD